MVVDEKWAILLDLDQTLVLTQALEPLRRRRQWSRIYKSFHLTALPTGTAIFLERVQKMAKVGVVTTAPRPYAERLLRHHRIDLPVLIAYHDVSNVKPHPEPILKAAEKLLTSPAFCVHVGDQMNDVVAANRAGAVAVAISWDGTLGPFPTSERSLGPFSDWTGVYDVVAKLIRGREMN